MPTIGKKVIVNDKYVGYVVRVFPPNKYHSGRFIVQVHYEFGSDEKEFWFDDYGVTVKEVQNDQRRIIYQRKSHY